MYRTYQKRWIFPPAGVPWPRVKVLAGTAGQRPTELLSEHTRIWNDEFKQQNMDTTNMVLTKR